MSKENVLYTIIGLLVGLIIGFMGANSINQQAPLAGSAVQAGNLPAGHPNVPGGQPGSGGPMGPGTAEVQAAIEKARADPNDFEAQMRAAELYYQIERYDGAIEFLKKASQLKPDAYEVIVQLGNTYFDSDKYDEAEEWYTAALAKKQDDVNVRTDLGLTFMFRTPPNFDRAIQEFKRSLETDPNHPLTLQNLAVAYTKKGDAGNASATLAKLEGLDTANPVLGKLRSEIDKLKSETK